MLVNDDAFFEIMKTKLKNDEDDDDSWFITM